VASQAAAIENDLNVTGALRSYSLTVVMPADAVSIKVVAKSDKGYLRMDELCLNLMDDNSATPSICHFDLGPDDEFCESGLVLSGPSSSTCSSDENYLWTRDGIAVSSFQNYTVNARGTYCLTYTDCNGCQQTDCIVLGECVTGSPAIICEVFVDFVNTGCQPLELFWDNDGNHVSYGIIQPGTTKTQRTFANHKWKFQVNGNYLSDRFTADCHNKTVNIDSGGCTGESGTNTGGTGTNTGGSGTVTGGTGAITSTCGGDCFIYEGSIDYQVIGNSMSRSETNSDCGQNPTSSASLNLPSGAVVQQAYLQWSGSGATDNSVTLNGNNVFSQRTFNDREPLRGIDYFAAYADVTNLVQGSNNYTLSNLDWSNAAAYCDAFAAYGAWSMVVIYSTNSTNTCRIHLCQDQFRFTYPEGSYSSSIGCIQTSPNCPPNAELTLVAFEGDSYKGEQLIIGGQDFGDNNFRGQTAYNFDILNFNLGSAFNSNSSQLDYTINSRLDDTQYGPAVEALFDFVKVLKYDVKPDCQLTVSLQDNFDVCGDPITITATVNNATQCGTGIGTGGTGTGGTGTGGTGTGGTGTGG